MKLFEMFFKKLFIAICMVLSPFCLNSQSLSAEIWDYPVKPGTEEWNLLKTHYEMIKVCQIPESIITNTPSLDLLNICLNYPLFGDIFAANSLQEGMTSIHESFNAISEFMNRVDCINELQNRYAKEPVLKELTDSEVDYFRLLYLEMLINQKILLDFDKTFIPEMLILARDKIIEKQNSKYCNSVFYQSSSAIIIAGLLYNTDYRNEIDNNDELKSILDSGIISNQSTIENLIEITDKYLNSYEN
jgi:hypothetical protein